MTFIIKILVCSNKIEAPSENDRLDSLCYHHEISKPRNTVLFTNHCLSEQPASSALKILCIDDRDPGIYISFRDSLNIGKRSGCHHRFISHLLRILCDGREMVAAIF